MFIILIIHQSIIILYALLFVLNLEILSPFACYFLDDIIKTPQKTTREIRFFSSIGSIAVCVQPLFSRNEMKLAYIYIAFIYIYYIYTYAYIYIGVIASSRLLPRLLGTVHLGDYPPQLTVGTDTQVECAI